MRKILLYTLPTAIVVALTIALVLTIPAQALMVKMTLPELAGGADIIVIGTVADRTSEWNADQTRIYTRITFYVDESLKGVVQRGNVSIIAEGGEIGQRSMYISDVPQLIKGEKYLLFLKGLSPMQLSGMKIYNSSSSEAIYRVWGYFQGTLKVIDDKVSNIPLVEFKSLVIQAQEPANSEPAFTTAKNLELIYSDEKGSSADYYSYYGQRWPGTSPTVSFYCDTDMSSDRINEVRAAANTWNAAGARFTFSYGGTRAYDPINYDSYNGIDWQWRYIDFDYPVAVTFGNLSGNTILECDMEFNTYYARWSTAATCPSNYFDVQTVALHEFGHFLSLKDLYNSADSAKVMYGYGDYGQMKRSLHSDDIAGIQYIYGTSAPVPPAPTLIAPANTATVSGTSINFQWNASTGATGYWLSVTKVSDGSVLFSQYVANVTSYAVGGFPNNGTQYRWAVAAGNSTGWSSGTSATFTKGTAAVTPPAPTLIAPANTATVSGTSINFQWNASTGATGYWLSVTKVSDGSVLFSQYVANVTSYSVGGFPNNGTQYRWAVAAGNSTGWSSGTSATFINGP